MPNNPSQWRNAPSLILNKYITPKTTLYMRRMLGSVMRTSATFTGIRIWSIYIIMWPLQIMISGISMKHSFWKEPLILATKLNFAFERGTTYIKNQKMKTCQIFFFLFFSHFSVIFIKKIGNELFVQWWCVPSQRVTETFLFPRYEKETHWLANGIAPRAHT